MNRYLLKFILPFIAIFVAIAILLFILQPLAPLLLLLSVIIQAPLIYYYIHSAYKRTFQQNEATRRAQFEADGDAALWLAVEEREARSTTFRYWPRSSRDGNTLTRVELLLELGRGEEAQALLESLEQRKLSVPNLTKFFDLQRKIEAAGQGPAAGESE